MKWLVWIGEYPPVTIWANSRTRALAQAFGTMANQGKPVTETLKVVVSKVPT